MIFLVGARLAGGRITHIKVSDVEDVEAARKAVGERYGCRCIVGLVRPLGVPPPEPEKLLA